MLMLNVDVAHLQVVVPLQCSNGVVGVDIDAGVVVPLLLTFLAIVKVAAGVPEAEGAMAPTAVHNAHGAPL